MEKPNANIAECAAAMAAEHKATKRFFAKMVVFAAIAMVMLVAFTATVGTTLAYFTTYASAKGSIPITLEEQTKITEDLDGDTKIVTIENSEDSRPVFVRAKAFSGSTYPLKYEGSSWVLGEDDYYYYSNADGSPKILDPGSATNNGDELRVSIQFPKDSVDGDKFNVVVVYETTPVLYKADGTPYADWTDILDNGNISSEGGDQ